MTKLPNNNLTDDLLGRIKKSALREALSADQAIKTIDPLLPKTEPGAIEKFAGSLSYDRSTELFKQNPYVSSAKLAAKYTPLFFKDCLSKGVHLSSFIREESAHSEATELFTNYKFIPLVETVIPASKSGDVLVLKTAAQPAAAFIRTLKNPHVFIGQKPAGTYMAFSSLRGTQPIPEAELIASTAQSIFAECVNKAAQTVTELLKDIPNVAQIVKAYTQEAQQIPVLKDAVALALVDTLNLGKASVNYGELKQAALALLSSPMNSSANLAVVNVISSLKPEIDKILARENPHLPSLHKLHSETRKAQSSRDVYQSRVTQIYINFGHAQSKIRNAVGTSLPYDQIVSLPVDKKVQTTLQSTTSKDAYKIAAAQFPNAFVIMMGDRKENNYLITPHIISYSAKIGTTESGKWRYESTGLASAKTDIHILRFDNQLLQYVQSKVTQQYGDAYTPEQFWSVFSFIDDDVSSSQATAAEAKPVLNGMLSNLWTSQGKLPPDLPDSSVLFASIPPVLYDLANEDILVSLKPNVLPQSIHQMLTAEDELATYLASSPQEAMTGLFSQNTTYKLEADLLENLVPAKEFVVSCLTQLYSTNSESFREVYISLYRQFRTIIENTMYGVWSSPELIINGKQAIAGINPFKRGKGSLVFDPGAYMSAIRINKELGRG